MRLFDNRIISHFDYLLIIFVLPLIFLSHHLISGTSEMLANKQLIYFSISFFAFVVVFILPIRKKLRIIPFLYWIGILLLLSVEFWGITKLGAKRWLPLPFLNTTMQPSELIKPIYLLMLGYLIHNRPPPKKGYNLKDFTYLSFYILLPFILIAKEPDLGTALVLLLVGYGVLFIVGVNWKIWASIVLVIGVSSPFIYTYLIKDYQKKRIKDFISEKPSYHVQQSIIAIGSGGLTGKVSEDATQTQLKFLPIATSDFIFAYYVERYGFLGALGLITLYSLIIMHLLTLNYYYKDDYVIRVFASGLALLLFFNMSVNILMVIGFAPVVGLPLP
ncbi:FtsW/RodA/SpoVE family cell cycle protein, partial [Poseidonibacter sp.]|uniref:FtsW/RodA/SpoVE family cell cycle protein n=1 Tax=Poseidonibacter sp. TaxID=2321188 RepID=UPI003C74E0AC